MLTSTSTSTLSGLWRRLRPWAVTAAAGTALIAAGAASAALQATPAGGPLATTRLPSCSWDRPGVDPFMGDVVAAVDRYDDIPVDVRQRLKRRMAERRYDDIAVIRRDSVGGTRDYEPALRDMHFGTGRVCGSVSRSAWTPTQEERGLVYCEGETCVIVPTVCRNVSRVTRRPAAAAAGPVAAAGPGAPGEELVFAPPGAGLPDAGAEPSTGSTPFASFADGAGPALAQALASPGGAPGGGFGPGFAGSGPGGTLAVPVTPDGPSSVPNAANPAVDTLPVVGPPLASMPDVPLGPAVELPLVPVNPVPEPESWALMGIGLATLALLARRRPASAHGNGGPTA